MQINPVINAPNRAILEINGATDGKNIWNGIEIRISPYLPSLRRIPAKTIDPATGASTWALGNHKWTRYRGIFTKNAIIINLHANVEIDDWVETKNL